MTKNVKVDKNHFKLVVSLEKNEFKHYSSEKHKLYLLDDWYPLISQLQQKWWSFLTYSNYNQGVQAKFGENIKVSRFPE